MYYFSVWVATPKFHGNEALVYCSKMELARGSIVTVTLRDTKVLGVVLDKVEKPKFETKPLERVETIPILGEPFLQLFEWMRLYYPSASGTILSLFMPSFLRRPNSKTVDLINSATPLTLPPLTGEQEAILKKVLNSKASHFLLHGETGSGKTRVYLELARKSIEAGKSVIILTPEIGLTPQLVQTFSESSLAPVIVIHSALTEKERRELWHTTAQSSKPIIIIGPRSALFMPLQNIGLIVMDEAHDQAYKQNQQPYYLTSRVAAKLANIHRARLVLGSATPLIADYFVFKNKQLPILRMKQPAIKSNDRVKVTQISLKDRDQFGVSAWLSKPLITSIEKKLKSNEQVLLFLNRRGTARSILCQVCGWLLVCPRCDISLTYHGDSHHVVCHTCGYQEKVPSSCPKCSSLDIIFKGIGTKALEAEVHRLFPNARTQRFDSDNLKAERIENFYDKLQANDIDILIGTQQLSKGLDLPHLSLVGIVQADTSLYFPDFSAEETTYQLIYQIIGRVGRGHLPGEVIIQGYHLDAPAIALALQRNYVDFYNQQLLDRERYSFPPYYFLLQLTCEKSSRENAKRSSEQLANELKSHYGNVEIIGPSASFTEKIRGKYRWQIIVRAKQRKVLLDIIQQLPAAWTYNIDPLNLL